MTDTVASETPVDTSAMTGPGLRHIRRQIGLSQAELAEIIGYRRPGTIGEQESGKAGVPRYVAVIARLLAERAGMEVTPPARPAGTPARAESAPSA